jgi:DNA-binding transcriptional MocR family regulator
MAKQYKRHKKGRAGQHVQLPEWLQASEAWATMKPGPRALYVELKRRFNGSNNGVIYLSHRDAAKALNVHRNTVGGYFLELEQRGFIRLKVAPHLGPSGIGEASVWALEELPTQDGRPAGKAFIRWSKKQNPRTKIVPPRHKKQDARDAAEAENPQAVTKSMAPSAEKPKGASQ